MSHCGRLNSRGPFKGKGRNHGTMVTPLWGKGRNPGTRVEVKVAGSKCLF